MSSLASFHWEREREGKAESSGVWGQRSKEGPVIWDFVSYYSSIFIIGLDSSKSPHREIRDKDRDLETERHKNKDRYTQLYIYMCVYACE